MHPILDHDFISQRYFSLSGILCPKQPMCPFLLGSLPAGVLRRLTKAVIVHFHGNGELVHHWIGVDARIR